MTTRHTPPQVSRLPIVGVMGSGTEPHADLAEPLGRRLAELSVHLLTGAGGGVMTSVGRAFAETPSRRGLVLGIVPGRVDDSAPVGARYIPKPGYPNPWVEVPILTHLWPEPGGEAGAESRNRINVLTADVLVVLPGGVGTASEVSLAVRWGKPVVALVPEVGAVAGLDGSGVEWTGDVERVMELVGAFVGP